MNIRQIVMARKGCESTAANYQSCVNIKYHAMTMGIEC